LAGLGDHEAVVIDARRNQLGAGPDERPAAGRIARFLDNDTITRIDQNPGGEIYCAQTAARNQDLIRRALDAPGEGEVACDRLAKREIARCLAMSGESNRTPPRSPRDDLCPERVRKTVDGRQADPEWPSAVGPCPRG
jgi:hypothetical protein